MMTFSIAITLQVPLLIALVGVIQIFFLHFRRERGKLPEPSIRNNNPIQVIFCNIIVVIMMTFSIAVTLTIPLSLALGGVIQIFFVPLILQENKIKLKCLNLRFKIINKDAI